MSWSDHAHLQLLEIAGRRRRVQALVCPVHFLDLSKVEGTNGAQKLPLLDLKVRSGSGWAL